MIFEDNNTLIIVVLVVLLVLFINMNKEGFEASNSDKVKLKNCNNCEVPNEVLNTIGNFKSFCKDSTYDNDGKLLSTKCQDNNGGYSEQSYSFMNPCRVLNFNKNRQELTCVSEV
jgi:hypothetical protein